VPGDAVSRDEPALQRLLHHDAAEAQSWRAAALPVSVARSLASMPTLMRRRPVRPCTVRRFLYTVRADFRTAMVATAPGEKLLKRRRAL